MDVQEKDIIFRTPAAQERYGFMKTCIMALTANMAAANIQRDKQLNWDQIVHSATEGSKTIWKYLQEDRKANGE